MKVTVTGATGMIGSRLVERLKQRGDEVTVLARDPEAAGRRLGVEAVRWDASSQQAPPEALEGRDAVVHLAGETISQRWSEGAKERIRASRTDGTANLVAGIRQASHRPSVLVSGSAVGYYGPLGDEQVDESAPAGDDFLAGICVEWEKAALEAAELGVRTALLRTGVVLCADGGALKKMLPPFKAGVGGPAGSGDQMMSWIDVDDLVSLIIAAIDGDERWSGPINGTAPVPVSNREFSKLLGRVLKRPAFAPVPAVALKALYGEMSQIVLTGQAAVPAKARELGFSWQRGDLEASLRAQLGR